MLRLEFSYGKMPPKGIALLLFISCITFHTYVFADTKAKTAEDYRAAGYAEQQKGNLNEALGNYTKAISLGIENATLYNDMGVLYEEIDLNGKAESHYLKAIQTDPHYLPPYINLAYLYLRMGRKDRAALYFKKRYELGDPMDPWAQKAKEELLKINPEYMEWILSLEAESLNKQLMAKTRDEFYQKVQRSQEYFDRAQDYMNEGEYEKALKEYDSALRLTPDNPKIKDARNKAVIERAKKTVKEQTEQALLRLDTGDTASARYEIQKILTTIPKEPILISR